MIRQDFLAQIDHEISELKESGLYKNEYEITSPQSAEIEVNIGGKKSQAINLCSNNYLGLADNRHLIDIAKSAIEKRGLGSASVRFICGTFDVIKEFEKSISDFLGFEDAITYSSCFAANGGVFQALFDENDAIVSANLNHASLIDGIRLSKSKKFFYGFDDMNDLEQKLKDASGFRNRLVVTDGVFSMDGDIAKLNKICDLCEKYDAILLVDDSHATGFVGKNGRGTPELCGVEGRIDILTTTLGKALGGTGGGVVLSKKGIIDKLRNKSRTYLFSNNISPAIAACSIEVIKMIRESKNLIEKLSNNAQYFRSKMTEAGFNLRAGNHPIIPVMFDSESIAAEFAKTMIEEEGIYVVSFSFPVVPKGESRIRVQISASHEKNHLDKAINSFIKVGKKLGVI